MADSFITQCPHCGTSFRVRTEQLSVANGSVRCGACLQVFSARNHVMTTSVPAQKAPAKPKPKAVAKPKAKVQPKTKAQPKRPAASAPVKPKPKPKPAPAIRKPPPEEFNFAADDDDDAEFLFADGEDEFKFEDAPGDSLFDEDEQDDGFGELSDSFLNLNDSKEDSKKVDHFQRETQELDTNMFEEEETDDESWAESMLEEIEKEDKISTSQPAVFEAQEMGQSYRNSDAQVAQSKTQSNLLMDFDENLGGTEATMAPSASQVVSSASQEIELDFHADERLNRLRPLGWVVVALLLVVMLAQLAWMMRDTYARMDQWRGLYQQACDVIGCTLPDQVDLGQIRTSVLVRDHKDPQLSDIKIVDVVLTNKAPFKQPFPALVMQFTDVNGKLVADEAFSPANYLKGELTGVDLMPMNTRVYISFPIRRPAGQAVNHQLLLTEAPL